MADNIEATATTRDFSSCSVPELIDAICACGLDVPPGLPEEIVRQGKEALPPLCDIVRSEDWWQEEDPNRTWSVIHAMHLLGAIGDARAADALLEPMRRNDDSDFLCDSMPGILARLDPQALPVIEEFVKNSSHDHVYRSVAFQGLVGMSFRHAELTERVIGIARDLLDRALKDGDRIPEILAADLARFGKTEDLGRLRKAFEEDLLCDCLLYGSDWEGFEEAAQKGWTETERQWIDGDPMEFFAAENLKSLKEMVKDADIEDRSEPLHSPLIAALLDEGIVEEDFADEEEEEEFSDEAPAMARHIGRNSPCPCGSGKKYKKCCGKT